MVARGETTLVRSPLNGRVDWLCLYLRGLILTISKFSLTSDATKSVSIPGVLHCLKECAPVDRVSVYISWPRNRDHRAEIFRETASIALCRRYVTSFLVLALNSHRETLLFED